MVTLSPTLNMECRIALVHVEHVGAGADVNPGILRLCITDGQDSVKVHRSLWELPIILTRPNQRVGRRLEEREENNGWLWITQDLQERPPIPTDGSLAFDLSLSSLASDL